MAVYGDATNRRLINELSAKVDIAAASLPNVFVRQGSSGQFPTTPTTGAQLLVGMFYPKAAAGATSQTTISFNRTFKNAPMVLLSINKSDSSAPPSFVGSEVWVSSSTKTNMVIRYYNPTDQEITLGVNFVVIGELDDTPASQVARTTSEIEENEIMKEENISSKKGAK